MLPHTSAAAASVLLLTALASTATSTASTRPLKGLRDNLPSASCDVPDPAPWFTTPKLATAPQLDTLEHPHQQVDFLNDYLSQWDPEYAQGTPRKRFKVQLDGIYKDLASHDEAAEKVWKRLDHTREDLQEAYKMRQRWSSQLRRQLNGHMRHLKAGWWPEDENEFRNWLRERGNKVKSELHSMEMIVKNIERRAEESRLRLQNLERWKWWLPVFEGAMVAWWGLKWAWYGYDDASWLYSSFDLFAHAQFGSMFSGFFFGFEPVLSQLKRIAGIISFLIWAIKRYFLGSKYGASSIYFDAGLYEMIGSCIAVFGDEMRRKEINWETRLNTTFLSIAWWWYSRKFLSRSSKDDDDDKAYEKPGEGVDRNDATTVEDEEDGKADDEDDAKEGVEDNKKDGKEAKSAGNEGAGDGNVEGKKEPKKVWWHTPLDVIMFGILGFVVVGGIVEDGPYHLLFTGFRKLLLG